MVLDTFQNRDTVAVPHRWIYDSQIEMSVVCGECVAGIVRVLDNVTGFTQDGNGTVRRFKIILYDEYTGRVEIRKYIHRASVTYDSDPIKAQKQIPAPFDKGRG